MYPHTVNVPIYIRNREEQRGREKMSESKKLNDFEQSTKQSTCIVAHDTVRREPVEDADLLAEAGDRIDNAVFDFICAVVTGHSINKEEPKEALLAAVNELSVEQVSTLPDGLLPDATNRAKKAAVEQSLQEKVDDGLLLRWDMAAIGPMTDYLQIALSTRFLINTCRPWQDDTECICYATDERCPYCTRKI